MARGLTGIARLLGMVCVAGVSLAGLSCSDPESPPAPVTLALVNARIWTGDPGRPWVDALAVSDGRVVAVGTSDAIEVLAGDADVIDVRQRLVLPGFIDTHTHLLDLGDSLNLASVRSRRQFSTRIATADNDDVLGFCGDRLFRRKFLSFATAILLRQEIHREVNAVQVAAWYRKVAWDG